MEVKLLWVRKLRELISDRILHFELPRLFFPATNGDLDQQSGPSSKSGRYKVLSAIK